MKIIKISWLALKITPNIEGVNCDLYASFGFKEYQINLYASFGENNSLSLEKTTLYYFLVFLVKMILVIGITPHIDF